jgi:hypothetical protein
LLALATSFLLVAQRTRAEDAPSARAISYHGYSAAIELRRGNIRAILCPQAGGRVLEFSVDGRQALYFDEKEKEWTPDTKKAVMSAGRFDYGPELTAAPHPMIWSGQWTGEITGPSKAKLISPRDEAAGVQLIREFELVGDLMSSFGTQLRLICRQTILNISDKQIEVCHWGRSFSPGGGIALVPLGKLPSRFPSKYAIYEDSAIINVRNSDEKIRERDGFLEILGPPRKPKLGFDSYAGWLGYLMPNDLLFVKHFETFPDRVYNEAAGLTLSIWYPEGPRIELEPIGPRERLQPAASASFTESWYLLSRPFPKNGEQIDLTALRSVVNKATTGVSFPDAR